jgi:hypothetical protein
MLAFFLRAFAASPPWHPNRRSVSCVRTALPRVAPPAGAGDQKIAQSTSSARRAPGSGSGSGSIAPLAKKFCCCASGCPAVAPNSTKLDIALVSEPPAGSRRASAFFTVCPSASKVLRIPSSLLESITTASPLPSTHIATIYLGIAIKDGCSSR